MVRTRRPASMTLAALLLGAEILDHPAQSVTAAQATRMLQRVVASGARTGSRWSLCGADAEQARRLRRQRALLQEVRADLLQVVRDCRCAGMDVATATDRIAEGLCAATDKLVTGADMAAYRAWRRGMVLEISEEPSDVGPPRAMATVDAGPGRDPLFVEWDSCERRLALVARLARAGVAPVAICDRLLSDLSVCSPLRYSVR